MMMAFLYEEIHQSERPSERVPTVNSTYFRLFVLLKDIIDQVLTGTACGTSVTARE